MRYLTLAVALALALATASLATLSSAGSASAKEPDPPTTGLIVVHMDAQNGSGIDGRAEIMPAQGGAKTFVQVFTNQVEPGSSHAAMLHLGCTGPIDVNLSPVVAQSGVTTGRSITTVDVPFSRVADGTHVVDVHGPGGGVISCGPIPAQPPGARPPEALPPAGSGPVAGGMTLPALGVLLMVGVAFAATGAALRPARSHKE